MAFQRFQPLLLESHVVIVVHVVDAHDANIPDIGKKPPDKIRPDKTAAPVTRTVLPSNLTFCGNMT